MKLFRLALVFGGCALAAPAQAQRGSVPPGLPPNNVVIRVQQPDNSLAAYGGANFRLSQTLALPPEIKGHPEYISISRQGAVLAAYPAGDDPSPLRIWLSNPRLSWPLDGSAGEKTPAPGGGFLIISAIPKVYFSSNPERLFWFENRKQTLTNDGGNEISVTSEFLAWTSDRQGKDVQRVAEVPFAKCMCETGACVETCPESMVWAPETGVTDFFFVTRWIPGQTQPEFQRTDVYRLQNGRWISQKLPEPVEEVADAAEHGNAFIAVVSDTGCCGWQNESDDKTLLFRNGKSTVIYDERERFRNDDYDVSFFTVRARFSPGGSRLAYTLVATAKPGEDIRPSEETNGKGNPEELRRLTKAIGELPRVEVLAVAGRKRLISLPGEMVAWLDSKRILILQAGQLVVLDVDSGAKTPTRIKATDVRQVFVR